MSNPNFPGSRLAVGWVSVSIPAVLLAQTCLPILSGAADAILLVPSNPRQVHVTAPLPRETAVTPTSRWMLVEEGVDGATAPANLIPSVAKDGSPVGAAFDLMASIPPRPNAPIVRRFRLQASSRDTTPAFSFKETSPQSLLVAERDRNVLTYNFGTLLKPGVPADRARSTYVHPLWGLDGEVLSDDFPKDHYHHRGLFWAWPHVQVGGTNLDLWMIKGVHQRFEKWLGRQATDAGAVLGVENGWYAGAKMIMQERVWLRVFPTSGEERVLDVDLTLIPVGSPVILAGAEGKSYGGLTVRFAPNTSTVITTPLGNSSKDLPMTRLAWADLTAKFPDAPRRSGAAIFIAPDHPDYPPMWLTRHYGVLCVGWPGVDAREFPPGEPIRCRYRVWIHRDAADKSRLEAAYAAYTASGRCSWESLNTPAR